MDFTVVYTRKTLTLSVYPRIRMDLTKRLTVW